DAVALFGGQLCRERSAHALVRLHRELEVLEGGMVLEDCRLLELAADAGMRDLGLGEPRQVYRLPEKRRARVGPGLAGYDIHHRRLPRAVRADHAAQLA